jgi:GntR family transcriptional regulator
VHCRTSLRGHDAQLLASKGQLNEMATKKIIRRKGDLDAHERVPRYLQVASALRQRIKTGKWAVGDKIATLEALENEFQVARVTVRQAIDLLQSEGILRSHQGKGTFVTGMPESHRWLQLATDWEALVRPIKRNIPRFLEIEHAKSVRIEPDEGEPASGYMFFRSIQMRGDQPFALASVHVADHVYNMAPAEFGKHAALAVIADLPELEISRAHQTLTIASADVDVAKHLGIALNAPVAEARCFVTDSHGVLIYLGEITYPGDYVQINIELLDRTKSDG